MALEDLTGSSKFIDDLVATNPTIGTDQKYQGDDHIRGIKNVLLNSFPSITGAVTATQAELNALDGITAVVGDLNLLAGIAAGGGQVLTGDDDGTTKGVFVQAAAPYGWTIDASFDDRMLAVSSTAGGTTGGTGDITTGITTDSVADHAHTQQGTFTTSTASATPAFALSNAPAVIAHSHTVTIDGDTTDAGGHSHTVNAPAYAKAIVCTLDTL